jgi:anti-sigma regulatory factor (Ser/Thr protein kinase)
METTIRGRFSLTREAPRRARAWARTLVDLSPDAQDTFVLLISELVGNSVRHSGWSIGGYVEVEIRDEGGTVRVEVRDPGPGDRVKARISLEHVGLRIVDALSDRWGVTHGPTTVWFELDT